MKRERERLSNLTQVRLIGCLASTILFFFVSLFLFSLYLIVLTRCVCSIFLFVGLSLPFLRSFQCLSSRTCVATKTKKLSSLQDSQRKHFSFLSVLFLRLDYGSLLPSILVFSNIVWKVFVGRNISFVLFPRKKVLHSFVYLLLSHSSTAKKNLWDNYP
jgi:hypothetical protein